jgi:hypothetical protein
VVAQKEQTKQAPLAAVKPSAESGSQSGGPSPKQALADRSLPAAQPSQGSDQPLKSDQSRTGDTASAAKPAKETEATSAPALAARKAVEPVEAPPSYAPPPPAETERAETRSRDQQKIGGISSMSGPRKSETAADKTQSINGGRADEGKNLRAEDDNARTTVNQASPRPASADEKAKGSGRDLDKLAAIQRNSNQVRDNEATTQSAADTKRESAEEKTPETRSVGGRKFKHQGNAWIDSRFKSSMTLKSISRGSAEFDALDSGLRSIAQQISGEVIVVWKSKAYLIR